jgi:uncharacterized protein YgbK (DUF1537 family)
MYLCGRALQNVAPARTLDIEQIRRERLIRTSKPSTARAEPTTQTGVRVEKHSLEVHIMQAIRSLIFAVSVTAAAALPAVSFAQANPPTTRAEVRAQLVELQKAGYNPASDETQYPKNIEVAEARVDAQKRLATSSYGSSSAGNSTSGSLRSPESDIVGLGPIYAKP